MPQSVSSPEMYKKRPESEHDERLAARSGVRFIAEVRADDPELAAKLRIEERELEAGGLN